MPKSAYASRYGKAVFQIALENGSFEAWHSDLAQIDSAASQESFMRFLENTRVPPKEKERLITGRFPGISPLALNLIRLAVSKNNPRVLKGVAGEFERLWDEYRGIARANVITAVPLDEAEKTRLAERLGEIFGKEIKITAKIDPEIVGGLVVRVNGKLIDGSIRGRLMALKKQIAGVGGVE